MHEENQDGWKCWSVKLFLLFVLSLVLSLSVSTTFWWSYHAAPMAVTCVQSPAVLTVCISGVGYIYYSHFISASGYQTVWLLQPCAEKSWTKAKPGRRSLASLVNHPISASIGVKWELRTLLFAACVLWIVDTLFWGGVVHWLFMYTVEPLLKEIRTLIRTLDWVPLYINTLYSPPEKGHLTNQDIGPKGVCIREVPLYICCEPIANLTSLWTGHRFINHSSNF